MLKMNNDVLTHSKETLELKKDLAQKEVESRLANINMTEYKIKYEKLKVETERLMKEKEGEYAAQIAAAKIKLENAQKYAAEQLEAKKNEMEQNFQNL